MQKLVILIIMSILIISCGGSSGNGGGELPPPAGNSAPGVPSLTTPANNALCIDNVVQFQWAASTDPEGDPVNYQIQVATDNQFTQNLLLKTASSNSATLTLDKGVVFYWRVQAKDNKSASSDYSAAFQFYTEGDGDLNRVPFSPVLVGPSLNSTVQETSTTLEWTASDVDGDSLTYDVYFGTENPPTIVVSENQQANTLNVDVLSSSIYYWKIVVKDNKGGQNVGQVWNFNTD